MQTPAPFRAGVVLVPLDVRVVDADGNPVTDLTAADFTIFEDGVRQDIAHFSTRSFLDAAQSDTPVAPIAARHRTFAIVLGRGRLNEPSKALDGLIDFVRAQLAPEDRVAVIAYLHLAELTTDHGAIVRLLERYRVRHEEIEGMLERDKNRIVGAPALPLSKETQFAIQSLFDAPALPAIQRLPDAEGGSGLRFNDFGYLIRAIEYLRHVEGEKHLVLVLENALALPRGGDSIGRMAAAARVAVSVIRTGGLRMQARATARTGGIQVLGPSLDGSMMKVLADRDLAEQTGGRAAFYQDVYKPLTRLARATSFEYLLGYYPPNPPAVGQYRPLRIAVNRRGVTVLYRHGYAARPRLNEPLDVRRLFTESSILQTAFSPRSFPNIPTKLSAAVVSGQGDDERITLDMTIDASRVTFTRSGDQYTAEVDVAVFVGDAQQKRLGEKWDRIDLELDVDA